MTSLCASCSRCRTVGRGIISDTSYEGYTEVPANVALGYTVMLSETVNNLMGRFQPMCLSKLELVA